MSYYGAKNLAAAFRTVRKNTMQIAEEIPEDKYGFRPAPETRTIAQTLVHIAVSTELALHIHGNKIDDFAKIDFPQLSQKMNSEETLRRNKAEIIALLKSEGEKFATFLDGLPESFLAEEVRMGAGSVPATKTRFETLLGAKEHEMHHRGQLMTLERLVGVVPHFTRQRQRQQQMAHAQPARQTQ